MPADSERSGPAARISPRSYVRQWRLGCGLDMSSAPIVVEEGTRIRGKPGVGGRDPLHCSCDPCVWTQQSSALPALKNECRAPEHTV